MAALKLSAWSPRGLGTTEATNFVRCQAAGVRARSSIDDCVQQSPRPASQSPPSRHTQPAFVALHTCLCSHWQLLPPRHAC